MLGDKKQTYTNRHYEYVLKVLEWTIRTKRHVDKCHHKGRSDRVMSPSQHNQEGEEIRYTVHTSEPSPAAGTFGFFGFLLLRLMCFARTSCLCLATRRARLSMYSSVCWSR